METRAFLFLQGPSSPLFQWIGDGLRARGHAVHRINICAGDRVFWRRPGAINYRGDLDGWPQRLETFLDEHAIGEIVLLGEERPHHRIAGQIARRTGRAVYAVEMGYFRPDWISIEHGGSGSNSHFPDRLDVILDAAKGLPEPDFTIRFTHSFPVEVAYDLAYNLPNVFLRFLHPHYRWHAISHPLTEYASWVRRFLGAGRRAKTSAAALERPAIRDGRFFLYPLQLETDYQLRSHSPFRSQRETIDRVLRSFAANAPQDVDLLIKTHPLDNGLIDWGRIATDTANVLGVGERVRFVHDADLDALLRACRGAIMVNSTVGIQAIILGRPLKALGTAIYDIDGVCDQQPLDRFWAAPRPPQPEAQSAFIRLLAAALHERGNFYSRAGARAAANAIAQRIHERRVNQPDAFANAPPRPRPTKSGSD